MGDKDKASKIFMNINTIFADAVNNAVFEGKKIVLPENILDKASEKVVLLADSKKMLARYSDVIKNVCIKTDQYATYLIIGIENQSEVDYTMAIRCFEQ